MNIEVTAQMLIRKPVAEVFEAFVDPEIPTNFWFTGSSGRLKEGKEVTWEWSMYGVSGTVSVKELEQNKWIQFEWSEPVTTVEWNFEDRGDDTTLVKIKNYGFTGTDDEIVATAIDAKGGFSTVLAAAKAYLEHGIKLNLTADYHPDAHID